MLFPQSAPLLKRGLEVFAKGEIVTLRIGNVDLPMHYEHALDISRWVRIEARDAKSLTGRSRTMRSLGVMHDADAKPLEPLPYQAGTAIHSNPKLRAWRREDVTTQGRLVLIKIGATTISLHFENALQVAQWIRVRAKEAMRTAGDTGRHWSVIGTLEDLK